MLAVKICIFLFDKNMCDEQFKIPMKGNLNLFHRNDFICSEQQRVVGAVKKNYDRCRKWRATKVTNPKYARKCPVIRHKSTCQ